MKTNTIIPEGNCGLLSAGEKPPFTTHVSLLAQESQAARVGPPSFKGSVGTEGIVNIRLQCKIGLHEF
jgi:hypothetical protein